MQSDIYPQPNDWSVKEGPGGFSIESKPERQELGCTNQQCFCTGRCRRTAEEEAAYQEDQKRFRRYTCEERGGCFGGDCCLA